ncbi:MAG: hypothetical protein QW423_02195 [Candidatus Aenigmatarchaeota archaeon]
MRCNISIYEESKKHLEDIIKPLFLNIFNLNVTVNQSIDENSYNISFVSKIIHKLLVRILNLPFGPKAGKLKTPHLIKNAPVHIKMAFIQDCMILIVQLIVIKMVKRRLLR